MQILLIIAVVVIISLISAAGKKKPNRSSEDVPDRPTMSDIQKAFMMSNEEDAPPRRKPEPAARQAYTAQTSSRPTSITQTVPEKATERLSARTFETTLTSDESQSRNKYANIDLKNFRTGRADDDKPLEVKRQQRSVLNLFENEDDFVRAVIYSEILTRKAR